LWIISSARSAKLALGNIHPSNPPFFNVDALGAPAYEALGAMLRGNTSLNLKLPPFRYLGGDHRLLESRIQLSIEHRLNEVGRGRLFASSSHETKEEWVDALYDLSSSDVNDTPAVRVSCLYGVLRRNPSVVRMS
jgi:hypothetical protein